LTTPDTSRLQIAEHRAGDATVLVLSGDITIDEGDLVFRTKVHELIERGQVKLIVDLSGVGYIDSSGIGMLVAKAQTVRQKQGDIKLVRLTRRTQSLLAALKSRWSSETFDDEESAVRSACMDRPPRTGFALSGRPTDHAGGLNCRLERGTVVTCGLKRGEG
jgi:anti-sigma B factor antagonist